MNVSKCRQTKAIVWSFKERNKSSGDATEMSTKSIERELWRGRDDRASKNSETNAGPARGAHRAMWLCFSVLLGVKQRR